MSISGKNELFKSLNCCDTEKLGKNFNLYSKYNPTFLACGIWTCLQSQVCFPEPFPLLCSQHSDLLGAVWSHQVISCWPWSLPEMLPAQLLLPLALANSSF